MNKKIVKRIWSQFLIQNSQIAYSSLVKANNDFENEYKKMITDSEKQTITILDGNPYVIYYNPSVIAKLIDEFIAGN